MDIPKPLSDDELANIEQQLDRLTLGSISRSVSGEVNLPYIVRIIADLVASDIPRMIAMIRAQKQELEALRIAKAIANDLTSPTGEAHS